MKSNPIIRLISESSQSSQLCKLVGNIPLASFAELLLEADLKANVREAKVSKVTDAIEESLESQPELFHFKTKGLLAAASQVDKLERNRFRMHFKNDKLEGIIDGGHNSLAIGRFILRTTLLEEYEESEVDKILRAVKRWTDLKETLDEYSEQILEHKSSLPEALVPFEVIYPSDSHPDSISYFEDQILMINAARNNNAQQKEEAKANQRGLYEELKKNLDSDIAEFVEWRTGEGGRIKARDLVALSLIPLSKLDLDATKNLQENPAVIFSSKTQCVEIYNRIMGGESDGVVEKVEGHIVKVVDDRVKSALKIMKDIPMLFDYIYERFPHLYSHGFGKISSVKIKGNSDELKSQKGSKDKRYVASAKTKFYRNDASHSYGEGFIYPLVISLRELLVVSEQGKLKWSTDPKKFIDDYGKKILDAGFKGIISGNNYDPGKIGKTKYSYEIVSNAFKQILQDQEIERLRAQLMKQAELKLD